MGLLFVYVGVDGYVTLRYFHGEKEIWKERRIEREEIERK